MTATDTSVGITCTYHIYRDRQSNYRVESCISGKGTSNLRTRRRKKHTGSSLIRSDGVELRQIGLSLKRDGDETFFKSADAKSAV